MKKFFRASSRGGAHAKNVATTSGKKLYQISIIACVLALLRSLFAGLNFAFDFTFISV